MKMETRRRNCNTSTPTALWPSRWSNRSSIWVLGPASGLTTSSSVVRHLLTTTTTTTPTATPSKYDHTTCHRTRFYTKDSFGRDSHCFLRFNIRGKLVFNQKFFLWCFSVFNLAKSQTRQENSWFYATCTTFYQTNKVNYCDEQICFFSKNERLCAIFRVIWIAPISTCCII